MKGYYTHFVVDVIENLTPKETPIYDNKLLMIINLSRMRNNAGVWSFLEAENAVCPLDISGDVKSM